MKDILSRIQIIYIYIYIYTLIPQLYLSHVIRWKERSAKSVTPKGWCDPKRMV